VTGVAPGSTFQADNKGLSTNVSGRDLKNMPAPNRSIQDIARLDPRIVVTDRGSGAISAMGQNSRYNNISVDSVNVGDPFGLNANGMPYLGSPVSMDTIEEWNINTANFDVSAKAVGASINAVTKSGTNEFHGSAYYAFQNASDMVGSAGWLPKSNSNYDYHGYDEHWTGGLTLGGPIIKDTLFFFLSYEKEKVTGLGGDSVSALDESLGSGASTSNKVSPGDLQKIIDAAKGLGLSPGSFSTAAGDLDDKRILGKLDWNINDSHRASLSWQRTQENQPIVQGNSATGIGLSSYWYNKVSKTTNASLHLFDDWTENFSTESSVSYQKFDQVRVPPTPLQPMVTVVPVRAQRPTARARPSISVPTNSATTTSCTSRAGTASSPAPTRWATIRSRAVSITSRTRSTTCSAVPNSAPTISVDWTILLPVSTSATTSTSRPRATRSTTSPPSGPTSRSAHSCRTRGRSPMRCPCSTVSASTFRRRATSRSTTPSSNRPSVTRTTTRSTARSCSSRAPRSTSTSMASARRSCAAASVCS
jgi:hypothetical protein